MSYMPKAYVDSVGGGGGAVYGSGEVDFGAFPGSSYAELAVSAPGIAAGAVVCAWVMAEDTADHLAAEHAVEGFRVVAGSVVAGVGFTVYAALASDVNEPLAPQHRYGRAASTQPVTSGDQVPRAGGRGPRIHGAWSVGWSYVNP